MLTNKKLLLRTLLFFGILGVWIAYSLTQPPNWAGHSEDGKWETDFTSEVGSAKGYWNGKIIFKADEKIMIQKASLIENGAIFHDWEGNEVITKDQPFDYLSTTETWKNKMDHYVLNISWKDSDGTVHENTVTLHPKQRFFVLPSFITFD